MIVDYSGSCMGDCCIQIRTEENYEVYWIRRKLVQSIPLAKCGIVYVAQYVASLSVIPC